MQYIGVIETKIEKHLSIRMKKRMGENETSRYFISLLNKPSPSTNWRWFIFKRRTFWNCCREYNRSAVQSAVTCQRLFPLITLSRYQRANNPRDNRNSSRDYVPHFSAADEKRIDPREAFRTGQKNRKKRQEIRIRHRRDVNACFVVHRLMQRAVSYCTKRNDRLFVRFSRDSDGKEHFVCNQR